MTTLDLEQIHMNAVSSGLLRMLFYTLREEESRTRVTNKQTKNYWTRRYKMVRRDRYQNQVQIVTCQMLCCFGSFPEGSKGKQALRFVRFVWKMLNVSFTSSLSRPGYISLLQYIFFGHSFCFFVFNILTEISAPSSPPILSPHWSVFNDIYIFITKFLLYQYSMP